MDRRRSLSIPDNPNCRIPGSVASASVFLGMSPGFAKHVYPVWRIFAIQVMIPAKSAKLGGPPKKCNILLLKVKALERKVMQLAWVRGAYGGQGRGLGHLFPVQMLARNHLFSDLDVLQAPGYVKLPWHRVPDLLEAPQELFSHHQRVDWHGRNARLQALSCVEIWHICRRW